MLSKNTASRIKAVFLGSRRRRCLAASGSGGNNNNSSSSSSNSSSNCWNSGAASGNPNRLVVAAAAAGGRAKGWGCGRAFFSSPPPPPPPPLSLSSSTRLGSSRCLTGSTVLMVMGDVKMAEELLAEAPLASAEEDFTDFNSNKLLPAPPQHNANDSGGRPTGLTDGRTVPTKPSNRTTTVVITKTAAGGGVGGGADGTDGRSVPPPPTDNEGLLCDDVCLGLDFGEPNLGAFSASLEDLVSSFDEKITKCLRDYDQTTDQLAPVQVRSQEEIMKSDQVWWTLTGNYGNIMPIDWSKSYARKMQLDALNINEQYNDFQTLRHSVDSSDEEDVDRDLDLHSLILSSLTSDPPAPVQSADEVIRQIEDIMAESCSSDDGIASGETTPVNTPGDRNSHSLSQSGDGNGAHVQTSLHGGTGSGGAVDSEESLRAQIAGLIRSDRLRSLSAAELVEVHSALEREVQSLSETLVAELAQRDELDYEKETKNTFISLLLTVQNKRRQFIIDRKRGRGHTIVNGEPKYLTTVIPYNPAVGPRVSVSELQILIKILHAINDDSPTVPTLLTDYILKVLCPT